MRKSAFLLFLCGLAATNTVPADVPGSADHPVISRYPGSVIAWHTVDNHRDYRIPTGPVTGYRTVAEGIDTEGRVTRIYHVLDGGGRSAAEVHRNYRNALAMAGFEMIAEGYVAETTRGQKVGSRQWRDVLFRNNPWNDASGAANEMARGSATSGGGGAVVAARVRADSTLYAIVAVYQYRDDRVGTLIDVVEGERSANLGRLREHGRLKLGARCADKGLIILEATSEEAAHAMVRQDPSVELGVFRHELHEFKVSYPGAVTRPPRRP